MTPADIAARNRVRVVIAFAAVYLLWGSVYLAIRIAEETMPPFLMGSTRMFVAGLALYAAARWRGAPAPSASEWRASAVSGTLMLGIGNGGVLWAAQVLPSGIVALIVAGLPLWIVVFEWLRPGGSRPTAAMVVGVTMGLAGIALLVAPRILAGGGNVDPVGAAVLIVGSMSWAIGSIFTRHREPPKSALVSVALQMIVAGFAFALVMLAFNELPRFSIDALSLRSVLAWIFLVVGGSLIAYTAYIYLVSAVGPWKAATYAYVNPVIAVILGWAIANEPLGLQTIVAASIILASVAVITTTASAAGKAAEVPEVG